MIRVGDLLYIYTLHPGGGHWTYHLVVKILSTQGVVYKSLVTVLVLDPFTGSLKVKSFETDAPGFAVSVRLQRREL
jgi:hypothetical protein